MIVNKLVLVKAKRKTKAIVPSKLCCMKSNKNAVNNIGHEGNKGKGIKELLMPGKQIN